MKNIKLRAWSPIGKYFLPLEDDGDYYFVQDKLGLEVYNKHGKCVTILTVYSDIEDNNGTLICEGDIVRIRTPYRTTQTHTGDNIPNGSYTEPMEPAIETIEKEVVFSNGGFFLKGEDNNFPTPLIWDCRQWTMEELKETISYRKPFYDLFDDPEEGDLQYLLTEYKLETPEKLLEYISGVEIIGNIFETNND